MKNTSGIKFVLMFFCIVIPTEVMADNWNKINHDGWNFEISTPWGLNDHNHQVVSSKDGHPVRYGQQSERFEVRPGDCGVNKSGTYNNCEQDRERSEMTSLDDLHYYFGDEYWYRISLFIPEGHTNLYPLKVSYFQFIGLGCGPTFKLNELYKGGFKIVMPHTSIGRMEHEIDNLKYIGEWLDFVINVKWSSGNDGKFKIWINKEPKLDYKGKTTFCKYGKHFRGAYFKYGVYRFEGRLAKMSKIKKWKSKTTIAYYDGIRISRNRDGMFEELAE